MNTFHDHGTGPAVVVLPGLAATAGTVRPIVEDLGADHRVITVELPGHGAHRPAGEPGLASALRHLHRVVTALGVRPFTLLGWSLGATVAYRYLERHGDADASGLISVEQTPCLLGDGGWPYAAFGVLNRAGAAALQQSVTDDYAGFVDTLIAGSFAAGVTPAPAVVTALVEEAHRCDAAAVRALLADAVTDDWRTRIGGIGVPTLLVHGELSQVYPSGVGSWLEDAVPDARLHLFPRSGHLPFLEERERFGRVVRDFVASRTGVPHG